MAIEREMTSRWNEARVKVILLTTQHITPLQVIYQRFNFWTKTFVIGEKNSTKPIYSSLSFELVIFQVQSGADFVSEKKSFTLLAPVCESEFGPFAE